MIVDSPDNATYAAQVLAALSSGAGAFLFNPRWNASRRAEALAVSSIFNLRSSTSLAIPTGGTGGVIRFVRHDRETLAAAVSGFSQHLGGLFPGRGPRPKIHAVQALPCCHVSGLMPVVRAWITGGELVFTDPSFRPETPLPEMPSSPDGVCVVSLVAAQLHRLLERPDGPAWLRTADLALVGGSSVAPELLERARRERIPVGVSYGLTEAAALVALYPPERFLADEPVAGDVLPHIQVSITPEGRIALAGESLARDVRDASGRYVTGDEGFLDDRGRLVVTGRADRIIVTGGEKVDPKLVEDAVRATGLVREIHVTGEPHPEWGRVVTAYWWGDADPSALKAALAGRLPAFMIPKHWERRDRSLFDEKGKPDRSVLKPDANGGV